MSEQVTVGIVTALPIELAALRTVLSQDTDHAIHGDPNNYYLSSLASTDQHTPHRVAAGLLVRDGTDSAAAAVTEMTRSFPALRVVLVCGIAAGVPSAGVRLGDIVSATSGIVDYRHVRATSGGQELRRPPGDVSAMILRADLRLEDGRIRGHRPWEDTLTRLQHANPVFRPPQPVGAPAVHRGRVGSADVLLRDAALRDRLAERHSIIAFEMEASGVAAAAGLRAREWFMIRGVSDLANARKNDLWHGYAAAAAAAYLESLLKMCPPVNDSLGPSASHAPAPGTGTMLRMVDAMLSVRQIRDEHERQRLVDELPSYIRSAIPYRPTARSHVIEVIRTCERFPNGRDALVDALRVLLGADSPEFTTLEATIRECWSAR